MAAKKTTKKAAKKTYPPAKKTVPKLRFETLGELANFMAENHAKTEAAIQELSAQNRKTSANVAENHAKTEAAIQNLSAAIESLVAQNAKTSADVDRVMKSLNDSFGGISQRLGKLTELVVVPMLRRDMNAQGHHFDRAEVNKLIRGVIGGRKEDIAEVDMLLLGPAEAMAVEIKTRLKDNHVKDHMERLQDLRDHEEEADVKGKKLFGAIVGVVVDDKARNLAKNNGLYVVEIREEEGKLNIEKPETCRAW